MSLILNLPSPPTLLLAVILISILSIVLIRPIYNVYFHPLRRYPGPKLWACTQLPWTYYRVTGRLPQIIARLHKQYGNVVRVAPDHLSYITESAWNTIYGVRKDEMYKNVLAGFSKPGIPNMHAILSADKANHTRLRRILAPAFNDQAIKGYEAKIKVNVDTLVKKLTAKRDAVAATIDLNQYFEWTAMDVISDVLCGTPHGALQQEDGGAWLDILTRAIRGQVLFQAIDLYKLTKYRKYFLSAQTLNAPIQNFQTIAGKLEQGFLTTKCNDNTEKANRNIAYYLKGLDRTEAVLNTASIVGAGTGTTATWLSATFHCLMTNPSAYGRVQREVRNAFSDPDSICLEQTSKLTFLHAVLTEAIRLHCPSPSATGRFVPEGGVVIDGGFVPAGTTVGVHQHAAYHSETNFRYADDFLPERWLDSTMSIYSADQKGVLKPWSMGPRTCLGIKLSYAVVQTVVAKLLWHFSFELDSKSEDWRSAQKATVAWHRDPLYCQVKAVARKA